MDTSNIDPKILAKLTPGSTVYTILRHVSQSGMSRDIDLFVMGDKGPIMVTYIAKQLLKLRWGKREGVRIGGCGMDMGFALVYDLSSKLNKNGFDCSGEGCSSNDHSNRVQPPEGACTAYFGDCTNLKCEPWHHRDGGYALIQRWL